MVRLFRVYGCLAVVFTGAAAAWAQTTTVWADGTGNSNWNNAANWSSGVPGPADIAQFSVNTTKTPNLSSNTAVGKLVFLAGSDAESFAGSRTLTLNGISAVGIDNQTSLTQTFANKFALGASQTWQSTSNGSGLAFNGTVNLAGFDLTVGLASSGSSTMTLAGNVSGSGSSLIVGGNGTLVLSATGSYSGATIINSGATLQTMGSGTLSSSTNVTVNSGGTYDLNGLNDTVSSIAGAGTIALGAATLTTGGSASTTFSGVMGDGGAGGSLNKSGTGTLTLSGANTFSGGVVLNAGSLEIGHNAALGAGTLDLSGGTLTAAGNYTLANALTMTGNSKIAAGPGVNLVFTSDNIAPASNTLTLDNLTNAGAHLSVGFAGSGASFLFDRAIAFDDAATDLSFLNPTGVQTFSGVISGAGNLVRNAAGGTTLLSANNTFTGKITLAGGTLQVATDKPLGAAPGTATADKIIFDGGTLNTTASFTLNSNRGITLNTGGGSFAPDAGTTLTYGGVVAGGGGLTLAAPGTLALSGANTFSGKVSVPDGILSVGSLNRVSGGTASSNLGAPTTVANGTIDLGGGAATGTLAINSGSFQITDRVINLAGTTGGGVIEVNGAGGMAFSSALTATGAGNKTLTLQGTGTASAFSGALVDGAGTTALTKAGTGTWTLNGASTNTFSGVTTVNAGTLVLAKTGGARAISGNINIGDGAGTDTLQLGASDQIATSAIITVGNSGVFALNGFTQTIGGLSGTGLLDFGAGGTGELTLGSGAASFAGAFSGSGTLIIGAGAMLTLGADFNAPNLNITLAGGTLALNGTTSTFGLLNVTGTSVLDFGSSTASVLTVNNITFQNTGLQLSISSWSALSDFFYAQNFSGVTPNVGGSGPAGQIIFANWSNLNTSWQSWDHQVLPAPEPATYGVILVGASLLLAGFRQSRRTTP